MKFKNYYVKLIPKMKFDTTYHLEVMSAHTEVSILELQLWAYLNILHLMIQIT